MLYFDIIYPKFTDAEKKEFLGSFIERVEINPEPTESGQILKKIKFRIPIYFDGNDGSNVEVSFLNEKITVETVVLLSQRRPDTHIDIKLDLSELDVAAAETKATYQEIKDYVLEKHGLKVSTLYISQVKAKCGITERENYNKGKEGHRVPQCTKEKEDAIMDALKHFRMI